LRTLGRPIGLVMVSPNLTYPKRDQAAAQRSSTLPGENGADHRARSASGRMRPSVAKREGQGRARQDVAAAKGEPRERFQGRRHQYRRLEKPLFELAQPGADLDSAPASWPVIIGSLLYRDPRADEMWDELYVRQTTASSPPRHRRTERRRAHMMKGPLAGPFFCTHNLRRCSQTRPQRGRPIPAGHRMNEPTTPRSSTNRCAKFLRRHPPFSTMSEAAFRFLNPAD